jgi:hypothetical protein
MPIDPLTVVPLEPMEITRYIEIMRSEHDAYETRAEVRPALTKNSCSKTIGQAARRLIKSYRAAGLGYRDRLMLVLKLDKALPVFGRTMKRRDWLDLRHAFTYFALDVISDRLATLEIKYGAEQRKDGKTQRKAHYDRWERIVVASAKNGWEKHPDWRIGKMCDEILKKIKPMEPINGLPHPSRQSIKDYIDTAEKAGKISLPEGARKGGRPAKV